MKHETFLMDDFMTSRPFLGIGLFVVLAVWAILWFCVPFMVYSMSSTLKRIEARLKKP